MWSSGREYCAPTFFAAAALESEFHGNFRANDAGENETPARPPDVRAVILARSANQQKFCRKNLSSSQRHRFARRLGERQPVVADRNITKNKTVPVSWQIGCELGFRERDVLVNDLVALAAGLFLLVLQAR